MKINTIYQKIVVIAIIFTLIFSPIFARKAEAQWLVFDPGNFANTLANVTKDWGLDTIAWSVANAVIQRIAAQTVNWINSGFKGKPAFLTDPEKTFKNIGYGVAGDLIYNNPNFRWMCSDFKSKVQIALNKSQNQSEGNFQCSLKGVVDNFDDFITDFSQGGWDGFIQVTQKSQNSPIGLYANWNNQITLKTAEEKDKKRQELLQNNGFITYKKCTTTRSPAGYDGSSNDVQMDYSDWQSCMEDPANGGDVNYCDTNFPPVPVDPTSGQAPEAPEPIVLEETYGDEFEESGINQTTQPDLWNETKSCENLTPGSVIQGQLDKVLGSGTGRLEVSDEINEIISALLNQLVGKIVGGIGAGLRGLSKPDSGNGGRTYATDLSNDSGTQAPINDGSTRLDQSLVDGILSNVPTPQIPTGTLTPCQLPNNGGIGAVAADGTCQLAPVGGGGGGGGFTPITASDGSTITGMPADADCQNASFDNIVERASQIFYADQATFTAQGITIANLVQNMDCGPGGVLP